MSFTISVGGKLTIVHNPYGRYSLALKVPVGGSGKFPHPHQLRNNHCCIEIVLHFVVCNQLLNLIVLAMKLIKVPYHHQSISL